MDSAFSPSALNQTVPPLEEAAAQDLILMIRRKEKSWVDWGRACQELHRSGYSASRIFEATGLEPIQQNQVIVAAQVYESLVAGQADPAVLEHFHQRASDVLYEFRALTPKQRVQCATFAQVRQLDQDGAKDLAKAYREFDRHKSRPEEFTDHPGDAWAFQYWRWARERSDLQDRSRLIGLGLQVAQSDGARQQLQTLLLDFTKAPERKPPRWPLYRLEPGEAFPQILPLVGRFPLTAAPDLSRSSLVQGQEPFYSVEIQGPGTYVAVPGWSVILASPGAVAFVGTIADLPESEKLAEDLGIRDTEPLLILVDPQKTAWQGDQYFLVTQAGEWRLDWFPTDQGATRLGQVILVLRAARALEFSTGEEDEGDWILAE